MAPVEVPQDTFSLTDRLLLVRRRNYAVVARLTRVEHDLLSLLA